MYQQHHPGSVPDLGNRLFPEAGYPGRSSGYWHRPGAHHCGLYVLLYPEAYSCTCNAQSPENKQSNGSEPVCHRCSRDPEPGTAIVSDLFSELRAGRLLGQLCGDPWHLLQTADLPVSPGQRNHPGNAPADRL